MIPFLSQGDLILICSPAKQIEKPLLDHAKNLLEKEGFQVEFTPHVAGKHHYFSGTIQDRLSDFQLAVNHPSAKAIICSRGGYGVVQLLDLLDWSLFKAKPKWIVGFSDITNFHLELASMNLPGLHATMPLNYADNSHEAIQSTTQALRGKQYIVSAPGHEFNQEGKAEASIIGGNLSIVYSLLSKYSLDIWENKILFLEDLGEQLYHIDRMLYALKFSGVLNKIAGIAIGSFTELKDTELGFGKGIDLLLHDHFKGLKVPVGYLFPAGHQDNNQAIMMGIQVKLEVDKNGSSLIFNHLLG